jgi:hypothetical protein
MGDWNEATIVGAEAVADYGKRGRELLKGNECFLWACGQDLGVAKRFLSLGGGGEGQEGKDEDEDEEAWAAAAKHRHQCGEISTSGVRDVLAGRRL